MAIYAFGGANIDINAATGRSAKKMDSNIGDITLSYGGVAHNVALNLVNLKQDVRYVSVVSDDILSQAFLHDCEKNGLDTSRIIVIPQRKPSLYVAVQGKNKDMSIAVNDMKIMDELTPEKVRPYIEEMTATDAVFVDANLPKKTLSYILRNSPGKVFVDPVSTVKMEKLRGLLKYIYALKPNLLEARTFSGRKALKDIAVFFKRHGVKRLYVSCGKRGACAFGENEEYRQVAFPTKIVNTTGAGDAFTAGMIYGELNGLSLKETVEFSLAAAKFALESADAVNGKITRNKIKTYLKETRNTK